MHFIRAFLLRMAADLCQLTRMHCSRMHTARSSSRHGGSPLPLRADPPKQAPPLEQAPPRAGTPPKQAPPQAGTPPKQASPKHIPLNFPLGCGPGPDPPQLPPWLWAWTRSPSTCPMAVGLDQIPFNFPLGCWPGDPPPPKRPAARHAGIPPAMYAGIAHPPCGQNDRHV